MARETKKIQNSQKIDLPFEVAQHYFKEQQAEEKKKRILLWGGLALLLIGVAAVIALPFLIPTLFITFGMFFPWFLLAALLPTLSILYGRFAFKTLSNYHRANFEEAIIQIISNNKYQNFRHYMLSKSVENNQDCTVFFANIQNNSIEEQIKLFHGIPQDTHQLLKDMKQKMEQNRKQLDDERSTLEHIKIRHLTEQLADENKIKPLRQKLNLMKQKIKDYDTFIPLLEKAIKSTYIKQLLVGHSLSVLENLHSAIIQNKNINQAFLKIEEKKTYLRDDRIWSHETSAVEEVIQEMDILIRLMLRSSIETNLKGFLTEDPNYYAMYFKYLPEEMTAHFSHLLENKAQRYNILKILYGILIEHPDPADSINQTIHHILANHFYREFKHNKTRQISQQACLHALKLDSSNEANANFKEIVIEAAFFFKGEHGTHLLSDEVQSLLRYSHENLNAYEQIKKSIQDQTSPPPSPLQFSESQPNLEAINSSETEKAPSTPTVPPKKTT